LCRQLASHEQAKLVHTGLTPSIAMGASIRDVMGKQLNAQQAAVR